MTLIYDDVYALPNRVQLRTIVGVDIKGAFDNINHRALLPQIATLRPGHRLYRYLYNFLTQRSVQTKIYDCTSPPQPLQTGVPQGAILSPFLCNIALKDFPLY